MKKNKLLKKVIIVAFLIYFVYTIIMQQRTLNLYAAQKSECNKEIEVAQEKNEELQKMKDNVNSDEYIEQIAREKLGMYYPNESVYIDVEN